ncbi:hypothetical protein N7462_005785 [Penicillium macrosclerotiorum]|uniref:uncharacterized protein n=1 Tax=Penicillium macrosclerotiorum TaxID=303699 RepID=UPI002548CEAE|nr:uncharacterized protein N7462_005785 [Penicillium macrosclerotiorum]KAJ5682620.1 hypothetical protein N7462_005785 [Penicillium macrosclerotiorum]
MEPRPATEVSNKRPRSPADQSQAPHSKVPKTHSSHLQINYLARQYPDNLPLVSVEDTMPAIVHLIGEYDGVLHRHESIAGNLGASPLRRPPRVLKSHGKDGPSVTWLDVVEFAKSKPEQFNLEKSRNGVRVCQFYTKQCRVEISEEDFVLIASGMPQKMIPPQPIIEDEEKELGALEILEKNLQHIIQMADQVSARARQLSYRLKNRRTAIVSRRENDASLNAQSRAAAADVWREMSNHGATNGHSSNTSPSGFVAVNANRPDGEPSEENPLSSQFMFSHSNTDNITIINGTSIKGASPTTRAELMKKFFTTADRQARGYDEATGSINPVRPRPRGSDPADYSLYNTSINNTNNANNPSTASNTNATTPVAIPHTPSSLLPPPKAASQEKDDGGPFKLEMVARMEELPRGERVNPPCDRCRRLHMDCLKNLTACVGCTKKHAKCSWRDVKEEELRAVWNTPMPREPRDPIDDERGPALPLPTFAASPSAPISAERLVRGPEPLSDAHYSGHSRRESAPGAPHNTSGSGASLSFPPSGNSPRRAMSETEGSGRAPHQGHSSRPSEDDDPDANQRLMQAILDTVDHHARVAAAVQEKERGAERAGERQSNEQDADRDRDRDRDHERRLVQA